MRIALLAVALAGCLRSLAPDVGPETTDPDSGGGCSDADSDPATDVRFASEIRDGVFDRGRCTDCHTGSGSGIRDSGLDLASYISLRAGGGLSGENIVIAGAPCTSILYQKIGPAPPFGRRMPRDRPPLAASDLQLVHDWIAEGAHDN